MRDNLRAGTPPVFTGGVPVFFKEEDAAGFAHIAGLERTAEHMIESGGAHIIKRRREHARKRREDSNLFPKIKIHRKGRKHR